MKSPLVVDIETVGTPFDGKVVSVAYKTVGEDTCHVVAVGHLQRQDPYPQDLLDMMADPERPFVSFTKYDARFLLLSGVEVTGPFYDVQVMCWVLNENQSLSLESTARRYLGVQMDKRIKVRKKAVLFECDDMSLVPIDEAPLEQLYRYNVGDTSTECDLFEEMWERRTTGSGSTTSWRRRSPSQSAWSWPRPRACLWTCSALWSSPTSWSSGTSS